MNRKTRKWLRIGALVVTLGAAIAVGLLPMKTTAIRIDAPVSAGQHIDTYVWVVSLAVMALMVIAVLGVAVWLVRWIVRHYKAVP